MDEISELSELSSLSNSLSLNSRTNQHLFGVRFVEKSESQSDIFYNDDGFKQKTKFSNRVTAQNNFFIENNHVFSSKNKEISSEGFTISPIKITKQNQDDIESYRRKVVTDRFDESSSDISMDDIFVLNKKTE